MTTNTKIKVFDFTVSNSSSNALDEDYKTKWYKQAQEKLSTPSDIEDTVNSFIEDKEVISILVNHIDESYHNNARSNTVRLCYTIIYKG